MVYMTYSVTLFIKKIIALVQNKYITKFYNKSYSKFKEYKQIQSMNKSIFQIWKPQVPRDLTNSFVSSTI
jgi:hypothetical protein